MTLDEALSNAFGLSECVRRQRWPPGSAALIDFLSTNPLRPFETTVGETEFIHYDPPDLDDLHAGDWDPCDLRGEPIGTDWRGVLSIGIGRDRRSIARGDRCTVRLNHDVLEGDWTLVWLTPQNLWLSVVTDREIAWRRPGTLPPLSVSANGHDVFLRVHDVRQLPAEDRQLYRLVVTLREPEPAEMVGDE